MAHSCTEDCRSVQAKLNLIELHLFVFLRRRAAARGATHDNVCRATAGRIIKSQGLVSEAIATGVNPPIGPYTQAHLNRHIASRPVTPPVAEITIPDTNTYRQARYLDRQREEFDAMDEQRRQESQQVFKPIVFRVGQDLLHWEVLTSSLRNAQNLPLFDLNGMHAFSGAEPARPEEEVEDVDHTSDNEA